MSSLSRWLRENIQLLEVVGKVGLSIPTSGTSPVLEYSLPDAWQFPSHFGDSAQGVGPPQRVLTSESKEASRPPYLLDPLCFLQGSCLTFLHSLSRSLFTACPSQHETVGRICLVVLIPSTRITVHSQQVLPKPVARSRLRAAAKATFVRPDAPLSVATTTSTATFPPHFPVGIAAGEITSQPDIVQEPQVYLVASTLVTRL